MGMGWRISEGSLERSRKKCACGLGEVIVNETYTEESDYPPFFRGGSKEVLVTCKNPECKDFCAFNKA